MAGPQGTTQGCGCFAHRMGRKLFRPADTGDRVCIGSPTPFDSDQAQYVVIGGAGNRNGLAGDKNGGTLRHGCSAAVDLHSIRADFGGLAISERYKTPAFVRIVCWTHFVLFSLLLPTRLYRRGPRVGHTVRIHGNLGRQSLVRRPIDGCPCPGG